MAKRSSAKRVKRENLALYVKCGDEPTFHLAGYHCETLDIDTGIERESDADVTMSAKGEVVTGYTHKISGTVKYSKGDPVCECFNDIWYNEKVGGDEEVEILIVELYDDNKAKSMTMSLGVDKLGGSAGSFVEYDISGQQVSNSVLGTATIDAENGTAEFSKASVTTGA